MGADMRQYRHGLSRRAGQVTRFPTLLQNGNIAALGGFAMKKSTPALVGLIVIETLLLLGAIWMVVQVQTGAWQATVSKAEAISAITSGVGGIMGVVAAILLLAFFIHRRRGN